jgi:Ca2+-binding EF-hand superfamily protein
MRTPSHRTAHHLATTLLAVLGLGLSACAAAQGARSQQMVERAQQRFADADTNHDGRLSRDEAQAGTPRLTEHFDEIDSDHDGMLTTAEIVGYLRQRRSSR